MYLKNTCNQFNGAHGSGSGSGFGQDLSLCNGDPWLSWTNCKMVPMKIRLTTKAAFIYLLSLLIIFLLFRI